MKVCGGSRNRSSPSPHRIEVVATRLCATHRFRQECSDSCAALGGLLVRHAFGEDGERRPVWAELPPQEPPDLLLHLILLEVRWPDVVCCGDLEAAPDVADVASLGADVVTDPIRTVSRIRLR